MLRSAGGLPGAQPQRTTAQLGASYLGRDHIGQTAIAWDGTGNRKLVIGTATGWQNLDGTVFSTDPLPPVLRTFGALGHSFVFLSKVLPGGRNAYKRSVGAFPAIASATVGVMDCPISVLTGVQGNTSQQIRDNLLANHITAMKAERATSSFLIGDTNDRPAGISVATTIANLLYCYDQMYQNGITEVHLVSGTPRGNGSSQYELTRAQKDDNKACHDAIEALRGTRAGLFIHNWWDLVLDTSSGDNYYILPNMTEDGIHFSEQGAETVAPGSAQIMLTSRRASLPSILPTDNTMYDVLLAPQGSLTPNAMMAGTGGTRESTATMITGPIPAGYVLGASNMTGYVGTCYYETINDAKGKPVNFWTLELKSAVAGVAGTDTSNPIVSLKMAVPTTNMVTGDTIKSVAQVITEGDNISNAGIGFLMVPAYAVKYDTEDSGPTQANLAAYSGPRSRETPVYVKDDQTQFELRHECVLLKQTVVNSAKFRWATSKTFKNA